MPIMKQFCLAEPQTSRLLYDGNNERGNTWHELLMTRGQRGWTSSLALWPQAVTPPAPMDDVERILLEDWRYLLRRYSATKNWRIQTSKCVSDTDILDIWMHITSVNQIWLDKRYGWLLIWSVKLRRCLIRSCIKRIVLPKSLIYESTAMLVCAYVYLSTYMPTYMYLQSSMWHQYLLFFLNITVAVVVVVRYIICGRTCQLIQHIIYTVHAGCIYTHTHTHLHVHRQQVIEIYRPKPVGIRA